MPDFALADYAVRQHAEGGLFVARREGVAFRGNRFVCAMRTPTGAVKAFGVQFLRKEPGVMVTLGYCKPAHGLLGRYRIDALRGTPAPLDLTDGGMVTRAGVKAMFHLSGEAHFSATGMVQTVVSNRAVPLDRKGGHLFTVQLRGPAGFEPVADKDAGPPRTARTVLDFEFPDAGSDGMKAVGWWYPEGAFRLRSRGAYAGAGPSMLRMPDGETRLGFLLAPPGDRWDGYRLFLSAEPFGGDGTAVDPFLMMVGGFGHEPNGDDLATTCIAAMYTDRSATFDAMARALGCIDIPTDDARP